MRPTATSPSAAAVTAALDVLTAAPQRRPIDGGDRGKRWGDALQDAARAADTAADADRDRRRPGDNPPSCTFVAAVVDGPLIVAGWVGDSRAYWLADDGAAEQLTIDDSWAAEQIAAGIPRAVAEADPQAHAITRWLGADSARHRRPRRRPPPPTARAGWSSAATACGTTARRPTISARWSADTARRTARPLALAEALVAWANEQGGHDNITVALARIEPIATEASPPTGRRAESDQPTGSIEPPREGAS